MKEYTFLFQVSLSPREKKLISDISDNYQISLSPTVFYLAKETIAILKKYRPSECACGVGATPKRKIIYEALKLYTPFKRYKRPVFIVLKHVVPVSPDEIKDGLNKLGILNIGFYYRAILQAIIRFPQEASKIKVFGVYTKKNVSVLNVPNMENTLARTMVNLDMETYEVFKEIAQNAGKSMNALVGDMAKAVCDTEFENLQYVSERNAKAFRKIVLKTLRIMEYNKGCEYGRVNIFIGDLKYSVQIKYLLSKYSIPSLNDFFKRIIYFIIKAHKGDIHLEKVRIEDEGDYNEIRLMRNAYRRELYANAH